jgi:hypothetical protein
VSIGILISVHDGLVLAADSASTLLVSTPLGAGVANVYDNANKIFNLFKGKPIGCVTFGSGSIGNASIGTLVKDLRQQLTAKNFGFDPEKYSVEKVANLLSSFLGEECNKVQDVVAKKNTNLGILLGGYSSGEALGDSWRVEIHEGIPKPPQKIRANDQVGISWGGQAEVLQRMIMGYSPQLFDYLAQVMKADPKEPPVKPSDLAAKIGPFLQARLQAQIIFPPMPIQDAIDLGKFLVHSAIMFSRFSPGAQVVGGPIEIAAITKHEGFKWITRKHYFEKELNPEPIRIKEPIHVVHD